VLIVNRIANFVYLFEGNATFNNFIGITVTSVMHNYYKKIIPYLCQRSMMGKIYSCRHNFLNVVNV
jgi:hypothetical protein